ncbi:hypothetical protein IJC60_05770 [bacterium]|nr:hypothetical protein [bacterium]
MATLFIHSRCMRMQIQAIKPHIFHQPQRIFAPKLKPLPCDTFSFSGLEPPKPRVMTSEQKERYFRECAITTADRVYNPKEFLVWADKIDYKKLIEIAPPVAKFDGMQIEDFLAFHYKNGTQEFTKETLSCKNLEKLLAQDLISHNELSGILTTYPATNRAIGKLPEGWGEGKEKFDKVINAINNITRTVDVTSENAFTPSEMTYIVKSLTDALEKPVVCQYIDNGVFGHAIKIEVKGAKPVVLKMFKTPPAYDNGYHTHGAGAEPQIGFYARAHNLSNYAKFHFGQVANKHDFGAFYVADFIDKMPRIEKKTKMEKLGLHLMSIGDIDDSNMINGKIVDYGSSSFVVSPRAFKVAEEIVENTTSSTPFGIKTKNVSEYLSNTYKNLSDIEKIDFREAVDFIAFHAKESYGKEYEMWLRNL